MVPAAGGAASSARGAPLRPPSPPAGRSRTAATLSLRQPLVVVPQTLSGSSLTKQPAEAGAAGCWAGEDAESEPIRAGGRVKGASAA